MNTTVIITDAPVLVCYGYGAKIPQGAIHQTGWSNSLSQHDYQKSFFNEQFEDKIASLGRVIRLGRDISTILPIITMAPSMLKTLFNMPGGLL